jgi:Fic family protein
MFAVLAEKREYLREHIGCLPQPILENYDAAFSVEFAHHSTAIEGNTLSLMDTKLLLEDRLSIGGKPLREIYEVVNHEKAFQYCRKRIAEGNALDENTIKDIHEILMENILPGGIYRNVDVRISGASHQPPSPNEMYRQVKNFYLDLAAVPIRDAIEQAAWTHAEFVRIHPFPDGNGRTSRLIMNYQLMAGGFLPVNIRSENRIAYYEALDQYAAGGDLKPFVDILMPLELERLDWYIGAVNMGLGSPL